MDLLLIQSEGGEYLTGESGESRLKKKIGKKTDRGVLLSGVPLGWHVDPGSVDIGGLAVMAMIKGWPVVTELRSAVRRMDN